MPKIDKQIIDKILETAKIEEVIQDCLGSYGSGNRAGLKKTGVRYKALCPFHDDRSLGSFIVYPKGNCYKCFSCGAKGGVVEFLMEHEKLSYPDAIRWLGKKYHIDVDNVDVDWKYTPKPAPPPMPTLEFPMPMVKRTQADLSTDNLVTWIRKGINWDYVQRARVEQMLNDYHVGHGKNGHTIFWQLDENSKVLTGKMMKYKSDGHRDKSAPWNFDFVHAALYRDERLPQYDELKTDEVQTLFGMHLLPKTKGQVNIVESEKTAVIMSVLYGCGNGIWMATGGKQNLKREKLLPIIETGRRIVLYPDRDAIDEWEKLMDDIDYKNMVMNTEPVRKWWMPEDGEKADIADVVLRMMGADKKKKADEGLSEAMREHKALKMLIERFNLHT